MPKTYILERTQLIERPLEEVFAFFSDAKNLEAITPAFLKFRITTPGEIAMRPGTVIDYRLQMLGIRFNWQTQIESFEPGREFVDIQARGPYRLWRHTHRFFAVNNGTVMTDRVEYQLYLGPVGNLVNAVFVRRSLAKIFDYRYRSVAELFGSASVERAPSSASGSV